MSRTKTFWGLLALFALLPSGCSRRQDNAGRPPSRPNIVFVLLDAARADHFGCYGYPEPTTTEIDKIAARGAVFLNAFAPATQTYDSIPLIMSSRYFSRPIFQMDTWEWGIRRETPESLFHDFDQEQILLPAFLGNSGYRTAMFHNHPWFVPKTELGRSFHESYIFPTAGEKPTDEEMTTAALDWIRGLGGRRFFVYYHVMSPHEPYPQKAEDALFVKSEEGMALEEARERFRNRRGGEAEGWNEEDLRYLRALYDGNLAHSDRWVGKLYAGLEEMGLAEETLFIITADHGELLGEHGWLAHGDFPAWDALIRVPLILVWPGKIPPGVRAGGLVELVDIFPTVSDLAGLTLPPGKILSGASLKSLLKEPDAGKKAVYIKNSVRTRDSKYLIGPDLFFDLKQDPGETANISSLQSPELKARLRENHDRFIAPHRERYLSGTREKPPEDSFYIPICHFSITPKEGFGPEAFPPLSLAGSIPEKAWQLNTSDRQGYLFCRPGVSPPPKLRLSCRLPDGTYRVSALVSPVGEQPFSPDAKDFSARFGTEEAFREPLTVITLPGEEDETPSYYLEYGPVAVGGNSFSMEIDFKPRPLGPFVFHHLKFEPPTGAAVVPLGEEELREKVKRLKSLGYL